MAIAGVHLRPNGWPGGNNNPVKAGLVHKAEEYVYSSASDYVIGKQVGKVSVALLNPVQTTYS